MPDQVPDPAPELTASVVHDVIRSRRTNLLQDPAAPVDEARIVDLIRLATFAPNHKRTWPWRFTVLTAGARARLGEQLADDAAAAGLGEAQVAKLRTKYLRSAVVLLVWVVRADDPVRAREDRDAVAAAVQTLLIAATADGLATYWGSVPDLLIPAARRVAEVSDDHELVALVYLGQPVGEVPVPLRPDPVITFLGRDDAGRGTLPPR